MQFRSGDAGDVPAVQAIERASAARFHAVGMEQIANDDPTPAALLLERIGQNRLLVAVDKRPVAFVIFDVVDDHLYIEQIDVDPAHAGKRIGSALIGLVEDRARKEARMGLLLSTFLDVPWNAPYYRRLGFTDIPDDTLSAALINIRRDHIERGLDETRRVFMRKPLRLDSGGNQR
ncbi:GNAT family N-acetyltransferase [Phyllobacterium myrsinacearum]|uniref:N-acetyltransferase n=1 Tax=Phyllobacterium myrsinacearum TaxID=28101 RepID=A0A2S9JJC5_9HYPH|nr:GNAT family N-acetyltransferase [Phyllobacterium myrsinacearum]PRD53206.1 N-acetyltransferase [Phyllobacterium myrsinacearum]PWV93935.1 putative N-acetyltransferase YhbS [Phyllobacterium myrsinacearum]RZV07626.1 putative N-acetyltransferase YhbS [Phyllobacterium myrsinacearum]